MLYRLPQENSYTAYHRNMRDGLAADTQSQTDWQVSTTGINLLTSQRTSKKHSGRLPFHNFGLHFQWSHSTSFSVGRIKRDGQYKLWLRQYFTVVRATCFGSNKIHNHALYSRNDLRITTECLTLEKVFFSFLSKLGDWGACHITYQHTNLMIFQVINSQIINSIPQITLPGWSFKILSMLPAKRR